jgi:hypothetical protein
LDLCLSCLVGALPRLGGEEEAAAVSLHPRADAELGVTVAGGGVYVVDAVPQQELEDLVGLRLGGSAEGGSSEDSGRALMPGAAEGMLPDHWCSLDNGRGGALSVSRGPGGATL